MERGRTTMRGARRDGGLVPRRAPGLALLALLTLLPLHPLNAAGGTARPGAAAAGSGPAPRAGGVEHQTYGRFGQVAIYRRTPLTKGVVVLISDDGGWDARAEALARSLESVDALVVGLDLSYYERKSERLTQDCAYPAGDFEMLSKLVQKKLDLPAYTPPVLAGLGAGATLAYGALAQAPSGTFAGAISLGFCPELEESHPLCPGRGLVSKALPKDAGFQLQPVAGLDQPWLLAPPAAGGERCGGTAAEAFAAKVKGAAVISPPKGNGKHQAAPDLRAAAGLKQGYLRVLNDADLARPAQTAVRRSLADLPLLELPVPGSTRDTLVVIVSGDGGWAGLDRDVAALLTEHGLPVLGLNTLQYFWTPRTPESASGDLARILRAYLAAWNRKDVLLVGYSLGAEVLPFMVDRLPPDLLGKVRMLALLGPGRTTSFRFELSEWLGHGGGENRPVRPEVLKLKGHKVVCIYGASERATSLCSTLGNAATNIDLPGAHYLGGNPKTVANRIERQLEAAEMPAPEHAAEADKGAGGAAGTAQPASPTPPTPQNTKGGAAPAAKPASPPPAGTPPPAAGTPPPAEATPALSAATSAPVVAGPLPTSAAPLPSGSEALAQPPGAGTGNAAQAAAWAALAALAGSPGAGFSASMSLVGTPPGAAPGAGGEATAGGAAAGGGAPPADGGGTLRYGRFGVVHLVRPGGPPAHVVLFFSGGDGWDANAEAMAGTFAAQGFLAVGIDTRQYLQRVAAQHDSCAYTAGSLENLSKVVQKRLGLPRYIHPLVAGYAAGATLAYGALAQAPPNTFGGAVSLAFCSGLPGGQALCPGHGLEMQGAAGGARRLAPGKDIEQPWVALQGGADRRCPAAEAAPLARGVPGGEVMTVPGVDHDFAKAVAWQPALRQAISRVLAPSAGGAPGETKAARGPGGGVEEVTGNRALPGLPVIEMTGRGAISGAHGAAGPKAAASAAGAAPGAPAAPAAPAGNGPLAVVLSGDGGWSGVDREVAKVLAGRHGVPVVGLDTLEYFWNGRTPEAAAADLERLLRHYLAAWKRSQVLLVGYSLGADVLPFLASRLPPDLLGKVTLVTLLGPSPTTPFDIRVKEDKATELPVLPEVRKLRGRPVLCVQASGEADSLCPTIPAGLGQTVELHGSHAFSGDYEALAARILQGVRGGDGGAGRSGG